MGGLGAGSEGDSLRPFPRGGGCRTRTLHLLAADGSGTALSSLFVAMKPMRTLLLLGVAAVQVLLPVAVQAQSALIKGELFLKQNGKLQGVRTLPSGLQIKMLSEGKGRQPKSTDTVVVHYRGRLINGTEFDSSFKRGNPATFRLNQVIKGWTEGMQLLREGGKAELYIPSSLGYGAQGSGALIGPDEALIFEVELIAVQ